jgi:hypothetical protein
LPLFFTYFKEMNSEARFDTPLPEITPEKMERRKKYFMDLLEEYRVICKEQLAQDVVYISPINEIAETINNEYWDFVIFLKDGQFIVDKKPDNVTRINVYKIISATEFSILRSQPIGGDDSRVSNAHLAFYIAVQIYNYWFNKSFQSISFQTGELNSIWRKFFDDRIIWLSTFDTSSSFPFFLNSQVWMLIDLLIKDAAAYENADA